MQNHAFADMVFQDSGPSEDCLYLNVFTPAHLKPKSKLPVMFWIYGGGFSGGSASEPRHDGDFLPLKGVILVTINYRLGVFGFLVTTDLAKEAGGSAGNYGLMDMVAALQWVKGNIAKFGGDPTNVTIFGQSAGSMAVCTLMAAAPAQGLFAKAIGESGGCMGGGGLSDAFTLEEPEQRGQAWAASLGASTLAELRALPAAEILAAASKRGAPRFSPVIDGKLLTEPEAETFAQGKQAHVPLLAGTVRDEQHTLADGMTAAKWKEFAQRMFGARAGEFLTLYPGNTDTQSVRSAIDYNRDAFIAFGTWKWIEAQVKTGDAPVYRYHFEQPAPPSKFHPGRYAFHSDDIEYVFGTLDTRPGAVWLPEDRKLSGEMMDYWTNFAKTGDPNDRSSSLGWKTGDPNGPGLPEWPRFDKTGQLIHLDSTITTGPDTVRARYEFLLKGMPRMRRPSSTATATATARPR